MQSSSLNIRDALSAEEICPLCLEHYAAADECVCVVCRAPSCPGCAESIDAAGAMRCYACRPAPVFSQPPPLSRGVSLPRPLPAAAYGMPHAARTAGGPPPLPFPLTSSPRGVRDIKPRPAGSVFVGLPPLPPELTGSLKMPPSPVPASRVTGPGQRSALLALCRALIARGRQLPLARIGASLARAHDALRTKLKDARLTHWAGAKLASAKRWSEGRVTRPLASISARLLPGHEKPVQPAERPSSISL